jgi:hypothetical protein
MIDLVYRLRKRAEIRRQISTRKSVQEGKPDRIADLLDEAADALDTRKWVGLTDDEIEEGIKQSWVTEQAFQSAAWWAEAKLKEKNT